MTPSSLRPPEVAARIVPGHWEGDLIDEDLTKLEFVLNNMPRKILKFATPQEVFSQLKLEAIAGVALQA